MAFAAYYLSFLTGKRIIDSLRFTQGYNSVQECLADRFGKRGTSCNNFVVGKRLTSEVFANLLVIGKLFGAAENQTYTLAVIGLAAITLLYSMTGELLASLRTDYFQMHIFLSVLAILMALTVGGRHFIVDTLMFKPFVIDKLSPVLMLVALLQIWSYPMHDPVMMDRGFLADRETTRKSILHAAWFSVLCIVLFGSLGIVAGASAQHSEFG